MNDPKPPTPKKRKPGKPRPKSTRGRGRPTRLTPALQAEICKAFRLGATARMACGVNGLSTGVYQQWMLYGDQRKEGIYADFRAAVLRAREEGDLELLALVRKGAQASIKKMGGRLALELLARRNPDDYSATRTVRHAGHDGGPVPTVGIDLSRLTPEQLAAMVAGSNDDEDGAQDEAAYNTAPNTPKSEGAT